MAVAVAVAGLAGLAGQELALLADCASSRAAPLWYINTGTCLRPRLPSRIRLPFPSDLFFSLFLLASFAVNHPPTRPASQSPYPTSIYRSQHQSCHRPLLSHQPTPIQTAAMPPKKTDGAPKAKAAPSHPTYQVCRIASGLFARHSMANTSQDMISDAIMHVWNPFPHSPAHCAPSLEQWVLDAPITASAGNVAPQRAQQHSSATTMHAVILQLMIEPC